jgi:hypothetical protein
MESIVTEEVENQSKTESNVEGTIKAATGLVKEIPIYQDALQPAAKELGKALGTVAKTVNVALAPISALIWGYDHIKDFVDNKVTEKLQNTPKEDIITPPPHVAGPALESLKYTGSIEELKELYANLLASSMDRKTTDAAHPCFVEIIKQLSSDEAKLLVCFMGANETPVINIKNYREDNSGGRDYYQHFTNIGEQLGLKNTNLLSTYWDNLIRLGLVKAPDNFELLGDDVYKGLEEDPAVLAMKQLLDGLEGRKSKIVKTAILLTDLGRQFIDICVKDHRV